MKESLAPLLPFVGLGPYLVVYVAGALFALGTWRRHPLPCALALGGIGLKLVASLLQVGVMSYLAQSVEPGELAPRMSAFALMDGLLHVVGLALIVAAVFTGRGRGPA